MWKLTVDPLYDSCQSASPRINSVDCLYVDCWSSLHQLLIWPLDQQCWLPLCWLLILSEVIIDLPLGSTVLIASTLIVDPFYVNCQSTPLGSTVLIASILIGDPFYIDCWSTTPGSTVLITSMLIVDPLYVNCWSIQTPTHFHILIFNIRICLE